MDKIEIEQKLKHWTTLEEEITASYTSRLERVRNVYSSYIEQLKQQQCQIQKCLLSDSCLNKQNLAIKENKIDSLDLSLVGDLNSK